MISKRFLISCWLLLVLAGCSSLPATATPTLETQTPQPSMTASPTARPSATPTLMATATLLPSPTVIPTDTPSPTPTFTPPPLASFTSPVLRPGVEAVGYLSQTCEYLKLRWGQGKAAPGTVVVPVMFHSIVQPPSKVTDPKDMTVEQFQAFVYYAKYLGFETITTEELVNFLLYNDPIPPRSMILIVDDRRPGLIQEHFMPVLETNNWTVTAAYIADPNSLKWAWEWMDRLYTSGRLDVQSHGYSGQLYIVPETKEEQIQKEIWDSTPVLEQHFGKRPLAFIWPGGNFTPLAVQIARQGGYQLGFTAYSRGPILFNWVPLGEDERAVNDPLMVLPRAWSSSANVNLDEAVKVADQAIAYAQENRQAEMAYYQEYCGGR